MKFLIILGALLVVTCSKELPSYVRKCKRGDKVELGKCLLERARELLPKLSKGIPEMKLPPITPLRIPKMELRTGSGGAVGFTAAFKDLTVDGGESVQVKEIDFDLDNKHIFLHIYVPHLHIEGPYSINGKILLFQLDSNGKMDMDITDADSTTHMNFSIVTKNDKQHIDLGEDYKVDRHYRKASVYFGDLFKDNPQLTESTNAAINANIEVIGKDVSPILDQSVHLMIVGLVKPFFDEYSLDELFG